MTGAAKIIDLVKVRSMLFVTDEKGDAVSKYLIRYLCCSFVPKDSSHEKPILLKAHNLCNNIKSQAAPIPIYKQREKNKTIISVL